MTKDRTRLMWGIAAIALMAGAGGFGIAKLTDRPAATEVAEHHDEAAEGVVALTPQAVTGAAILVQPVSSGAMSGEILAQATVTGSPNGQAVLTARAAGAVTRIYKRLGDPVRAGEVLAVVESREAAQIAADRSVASAKVTLAQRALAREKSLYEQRVSPRVDYEQAQAEAQAAGAEARRAETAAGAAQVTPDGRGVVVSSPISGRVTAASANLGAFVQPETELFRIADPQRLQVEAAISSADAPRIAPGDRALVELADGRMIEGRVRSITPSLSAETRTATAVLDVPPLGLQPGQSVRARIIPRVAGRSTAIVVPEEAVQSLQGRDIVFVRTATGFKAVQVTVGQRSAGRAEIVAGLAAGQSIAARNAFLLKAELGKAEGEEH
jgi:cobalt-zinc-cadmium efflux system membrane fusion protein